jgi:hypothetical protein
MKDDDGMECGTFLPCSQILRFCFFESWWSDECLLLWPGGLVVDRSVWSRLTSQIHKSVPTNSREYGLLMRVLGIATVFRIVYEQTFCFTALH